MCMNVANGIDIDYGLPIVCHANLVRSMHAIFAVDDCTEVHHMSPVYCAYVVCDPDIVHYIEDSVDACWVFCVGCTRI